MPLADTAHATCRQYYGGLESGQTAYPLQYKDFPTPLELGAVRLGIFLLADAQALQMQVLQATEDIMHALPQGELLLLTVALITRNKH